MKKEKRERRRVYAPVGRDRTCPECGEGFLVSVGYETTYAWRIRRTYYCSYGCMRAVEKRMEASK